MKITDRTEINVLCTGLGSNRDESLCECPQCGRDKFYLNETKGVGHCKVCAFTLSRASLIEAERAYREIRTVDDVLSYLDKHSPKHRGTLSQEVIGEFGIAPHLWDTHSGRRLITITNGFKHLNLFNRDNEGKIRPKWFLPRTARGKGFYNLDRLTESKDYLEKDRVFIVNGEWALWKLWQQTGMHGICLLAGEGPKTRESYGRLEFAKGRTVYIFSDGDETAHLGTEALKPELLAFTKLIKVIEIRHLLNTGKDLEDYFCQFNEHDFKRLLSVVERRYDETDSGNAEMFAELFGDRIKYVTEAKKFAQYANGKWSLVEDEPIIANCIRAMKFGHALAGENGDWFLKSQSKARLHAMKDLAKSHLSISITSFDSNPELLNCKNGVLDLKTAAFSAHSPGKLFMKQSPVEYCSDSSEFRKSRFAQFIVWAMNGDQQLVRYLQKLMGLCLSGKTEQLFFIWFGNGANGKTTLANIVSHILGDYAISMRSETLLESSRSGSGANNDIARLHGARVAIASETGLNNRLNESQIKELTGGDRITARFLFKENFEFVPQSKLIMLTNNKPIIRGGEKAIWRRMVLLPFKNSLSEEQINTALPNQLRSEAGLILNWMVEGYREYLREGLKLPEAARDAVQDYRSESDVLAEFLETRCEEGDDYNETSKKLYRAYINDCESSSIEPVSHNSFGRILGEKGFERSKNRTGERAFFGIRLKSNSVHCASAHTNSAHI